MKDTLQDYYESQRNIVEFNNSCIIFGFSKHLDDNTVRRAKNKYCAAASVKQIRIHDFRHSHVSLLINMGLSPFEISKRLGHSMEMVQQVYAHMFPEVQKNIINILNKLE